MRIDKFSPIKYVTGFHLTDLIQAVGQRFRQLGVTPTRILQSTHIFVGLANLAVASEENKAVLYPDAMLHFFEALALSREYTFNVGLTAAEFANLFYRMGHTQGYSAGSCKPDTLFETQTLELVSATAHVCTASLAFDQAYPYYCSMKAIYDNRVSLVEDLDDGNLSAEVVNRDLSSESDRSGSQSPTPLLEKSTGSRKVVDHGVTVSRNRSASLS